MAKEQSNTKIYVVLACLLLAFAGYRYVSSQRNVSSNDETKTPVAPSNTGNSTNPATSQGAGADETNGDTKDPAKPGNPAKSPAQPIVVDSKDSQAKFDRMTAGLDPDDGGQLKILAKKRYFVLLAVTANSVAVEDVFVKDLPYRQINAKVRSNYVCEMTNDAGKVLFHAPIEVDNLCLGVGPEHADDHIVGDVVFPHESTALFPLPLLPEATRMVIKRHIESVDSEEKVIGILEIPKKQ